jgi:hypothetical protein
VSWEDVVEAETDVASGDADVSTMFYIMHPVGRGILKTRLKALNTAEFLMDQNGMVNGYPSLVSTQITSTHMFFGDFSQEMLGEWGVLDIQVNPYTGDTAGLIRVVGFITVDCGLRQAASISLADDLS